MSSLWLTPPSSLSILWKWDALHSGLARPLDINRESCLSFRVTGKGKNTCLRQEKLESVHKLPRCFSGLTQIHSCQSEDSHCYVSFACLWGCAGCPRDWPSCLQDTCSHSECSQNRDESGNMWTWREGGREQSTQRVGMRDVMFVENQQLAVGSCSCTFSHSVIK